MNERRYKIIITETVPYGGPVYEGSIETDCIEDAKAYLRFYEEKIKIEEGEKNVRI